MARLTPRAKQDLDNSTRKIEEKGARLCGLTPFIIARIRCYRIRANLLSTAFCSK